MPSFNLCRICLTEDTNASEMHPLFDEKNGRCEEILQKIEECGGIVLKPHDEFPKMICDRCLESLNASYKFREMCQASEQALLDAVVKSELKTEPPETTSVADAIREASSDIFFDLHTEFIDAQEVEFDDIADDREPHDYVDVDSASPGFVFNSSECSDDDDILDQDDTEDFDPIVRKKKTTKKTKAGLNTKKRKSALPACKVKKRGRPRLHKHVEPSGSDNDKEMDADETQRRVAKKKSVRKNKNLTDDPPSSIMCEICGNTYSKQSLLNMHLRRHLATKPFECEICGKTFACPSEIRRHIRIHTGEKPYICKFCGRTFADRSTNIKHERIHTNERPFICKTCGKSFTYSNVLKNHMLVHTGEKPFACQPCKKTFSRKHQLDQHLSTLTHQLTVRKSGISDVTQEGHAPNASVDDFVTVTAESIN